MPVTDNGGVIGALRVSTPMTAVDSSVRSSWLALLLIGIAVVGAGLVLAWILAGSIAGPVEKLRSAAGRLGRGDLDARVDPEGPQELDELGQTFNRMAGALSSNLNAQRDFVANASHQLRTPLTGIKLRLEAIRGEGGPAAEEAAKAEAELDRLSALVDDLLSLARASSEEAAAEPVDLGDAARAAERRWAEPAATAGHDLALADGQGGRILAAPADIAHILDNLIENAIRYSPAGARITVGTEPGALYVADTGPGIPPRRARARVRALLPRRRRAQQRPREPASASPSWPSWRSAGAGASTCSTAPAHTCARRSLPTPHPDLTIPEESPC